MLTSESIASLSSALISAQADIEHPTRNATNPHLRNKFANLTEVINRLRPALAKHGLAFIQTVDSAVNGDAPHVTVTTRLIHTSGEWIQGTVGLPVEAQKGLNMPQSAGVVITYLRRYGLSAICGVASEPDDDGNEGKDTATKPTVQQRLNGKHKDDATPEQLASIRKLVAETKSDTDAICGFYKVEKLDNLTTKQADQVIARLNQKMPQHAA